MIEALKNLFVGDEERALRKAEEAQENSAREKAAIESRVAARRASWEALLRELAELDERLANGKAHLDHFEGKTRNIEADLERLTGLPHPYSETLENCALELVRRHGAALLIAQRLTALEASRSLVLSRVREFAKQHNIPAKLIPE